MPDLPTVTLDFSRKGNAAWDDAELVSAYDAAMNEFHIHHPGPGSWLDKATAALARGLPLPGASAYGTSWYTAYEAPSSSRGTKRVPPPAEADASEAAGARPKKRTAQAQVNGAQGSLGNPYAAGRAASPVYQPSSPGAGAANRGSAAEQYEEDDEDEDDDEGEGEDESGEGAAPEHWAGYDGGYSGGHGGYGYADAAPAGAGAGAWGDAAAHDGVFPPAGAAWPAPGAVADDDALGYAMNAQYWAGYWMGLVRGRREAGGGGAAGGVGAAAAGWAGQAAQAQQAGPSAGRAGASERPPAAASTRQVNGLRR